MIATSALNVYKLEIGYIKPEVIFRPCHTHWSIQFMKNMYQENCSRSSTIKSGTQSYTLVVFCDDETDLPTCLAMRGDPFTKAALYFWPVSFFV